MTSEPFSESWDCKEAAANVSDKFEVASLLSVMAELTMLDASLIEVGFGVVRFAWVGSFESAKTPSGRETAVVGAAVVAGAFETVGVVASLDKAEDKAPNREVSSNSEGGRNSFGLLLK